MKTDPFHCFFTTATGEGWREVEQLLSEEVAGTHREVLVGESAPNVASLLSNLQARLSIPDSIMSWDALEGHLAYSRAISPGDFWLVFTDAHLLLRDEDPIQFKILNCVLNVANRIRAGKVRYKVIWQAPAEHAAAVRQCLIDADFDLSTPGSGDDPAFFASEE